MRSADIFVPTTTAAQKNQGHCGDITCKQQPLRKICSWKHITDNSTV
jgi:hypothetical protein